MVTVGKSHLVFCEGLVPGVDEGGVVPDLFVAEDLLLASHDCCLYWCAGESFSFLSREGVRGKERPMGEVCENVSRNWFDYSKRQGW